MQWVNGHSDGVFRIMLFCSFFFPSKLPGHSNSFYPVIHVLLRVCTKVVGTGIVILKCCGGGGEMKGGGGRDEGRRKRGREEGEMKGGGGDEGRRGR